MDITWFIVKILLIIVLLLGTLALSKFTFRYMNWHFPKWSGSWRKKLILVSCSLVIFACVFTIGAITYDEFATPSYSPNPYSPASSGLPKLPNLLPELPHLP